MIIMQITHAGDGFGGTQYVVLYTDDARQRDYRTTISGENAAALKIALFAATTQAAHDAAVIAAVEAELAASKESLRKSVKMHPSLVDQLLASAIDLANDHLSDARARTVAATNAIAAREEACKKLEEEATRWEAHVAARTAEAQRLDLEMNALRAERTETIRAVSALPGVLAEAKHYVDRALAQVAEREAAERAVEADAAAKRELARIKKIVEAEIAAREARAPVIPTEKP